MAVHERFPIWDHVNVQRGVDAYLARHGSAGTWFGMATGMMRPHQDLLSRLAVPAPGPMGKAGSASYGTAAAGPDTDTEVVALGLIATTAPGGAPVVIGMRAEREFGPPYGDLEILAARINPGCHAAALGPVNIWPLISTSRLRASGRT